MNLALIGKQVWRIQKEPSALWVRLLKSIYFPRCSIWGAKQGQRPSWAWRSIIKARDFIDKNKAWLVKDGKEINVFGDKWLCTGERIWGCRGGNNELKVHELLEDDGRGWCARKLATHLPVQYAKMAISTPLNPNLMEDTPIWPNTHTGTYSVKSGYTVAMEELVSGQDPSVSNSDAFRKLWKQVWGTRVQPKIKHFIWKALKGILPTRVNLRKKKIPVDSMCPICMRKEETVEHLLCSCDRVRAVWFGSQFNWSVEMGESENLQHWIMSKLDCLARIGEEKEWRIALFFNYLWSIWKARNEFIFEGRRINLEFIIKRAEENMKEFWVANVIEKREDTTMHTNQNQNHQWTPPIGDMVKINCDAAYDLNSLKGASAVLVRDRDGDLLTGSSRVHPCVSPLQAEALALNDAMDLICALDVQVAIVESDNATVVNACLGGLIPWQIDGIVNEIRRKLSLFNRVEVRWIRREANKSADLVAKLMLKGDLPVYWRWMHPVKLRVALMEDRLVCRSSSPR